MNALLVRLFIQCARACVCVCERESERGLLNSALEYPSVGSLLLSVVVTVVCSSSIKTHSDRSHQPTLSKNTGEKTIGGPHVRY